MLLMCPQRVQNPPNLPLFKPPPASISWGGGGWGERGDSVHEGSGTQGSEGASCVGCPSSRVTVRRTTRPSRPRRGGRDPASICARCSFFAWLRVLRVTISPQPAARPSTPVTWASATAREASVEGAQAWMKVPVPLDRAGPSLGLRFRLGSALICKAWSGLTSWGSSQFCLMRGLKIEKKIVLG